MNIYNVYNIYCFPFCLCFNPIFIVGAAAKPLYLSWIPSLRQSGSVCAGVEHAADQS